MSGALKRIWRLAAQVVAVAAGVLIAWRMASGDRMATLGRIRLKAQSTA